MISQFEDELEVFFGEATGSLARVYARLPRGEWPADAKLAGKLTGPTCPYAQTLPASYRFTDRGPGETLLAEAVVPDPCMWTPRMPYLYQVEIELRRGSEVLAQAARPFGIRPLGVNGKNLIYEGKRWVLRGGLLRGSSYDFAQWHEAEAAMLVSNPKEIWCAEASRVGVFMIVKLEGTEDVQRRIVRKLVRHAAVGIVLSDAVGSNDTANSLVGGHEKGSGVMPGGDLLFRETVAGMSPDPLGRAIVACRSDAEAGDPFAIREACDRLQRDLAPQGDFAGYIV